MFNLHNETDAASVLRAVKNAIREPFAFPGGYAKRLVMYDGEMMCHACARENFKLIAQSTIAHDRDGWQAIGAMIHWEGPAENCAHCGRELPSEYGDPGS